MSDRANTDKGPRERPLGSATPRRILLVSPDAPAPLDRGFRIRVHYLAAGLAGAFSVTLLAMDGGEGCDLGPLLSLGVEVLTVKPARAGGWQQPRRAARLARGESIRWSERRVPALARALARLHAAGRRFDAIQVETPQLVDHGWPTGTIILDEHNLWYELLERQAARTGRRRGLRAAVRGVDIARYKGAELRTWQRVRACLVTSEREREIVRAAGARAVLVPNGVDFDRLHGYASHRPVTGSELLFVGLLSYSPNDDAVRWMTGAILPLVRRSHPEAKLIVVGPEARSDLVALARPTVTVTGAVVDVRPFLARAAVAVVPIRVGSGTRLKLLEALGMGIPVVTTSVGCEGVAVRDGEHVLVADDAVSFAAAVSRLLDDRDLAARIGDTGRRLARARYDWQVTTRPLVDFYTQELGDSRRSE